MKRVNNRLLNLFPWKPLAALCLICSQGVAQSVDVDANTEYQTIRGFGGMNGVGWIDDLTPAQVETAFGSGPDQLGLSIMRVRIDPSSSNWDIQVPSAAQAHSMGALLLATPWSPPAHMKSNNSLTNGGKLLSEYYDDYTNHLLDFADYMEQNGAPLHAMSLQNEPDWLPDYSSCEWSPSDFVNFLSTQGYRFGSLQVAAAESLRFDKAYTDPILNDANANQHVDIVAGHLYGSEPSDYPLARQKGKEIWMTEHYTDSDNSANDWPLALDVGTELHNSMVSNFNAYIWWYIRRYYGLLTEDGNISKRGYILSQYARFVRPGYTRIAATEKPHDSVSVTAYKGPNNQIALVMVNTSEAHRYIEVDLSNTSVDSFIKRSTSETLNVGYGGTYEVTDGSTSFYLDPQSVATFISETGGASSASSESSSSAQSSQSSSSSSSSANNSGEVSCHHEVTNEWATGFVANIRIENDGSQPIEGWTVHWEYENSRITNSWSANLTGDNPYSASAMNWNATIAPGGSVEFGVQGTKNSDNTPHPTVTGDICD